MTLQEILRTQLERDEGYEEKPYKCTAGHWTVGIGYNLDANPLKLSKTEIGDFYATGCSKERAYQLLDCMILKSIERCEKYPFYAGLNDERKAVLINMTYQTGGISKWRRTLAALNKFDYVEAAREMSKSLWAMQTPKRAKRLIEQMQSGKLVR